jgi:hypothetical protein
MVTEPPVTPRALPGVRPLSPAAAIDFRGVWNDRQSDFPPHANRPMRRLLALVAIAASFGCGSDILGPVQTVDGTWSGLQNGYSMSLSLTQTGTAVTGIVDIVGVGGAASGTVSGTFVTPDVNFTFSFQGVPDVTYRGTLSNSQAKIFAQLNGAGFDNLELDVRKR